MVDPALPTVLVYGHHDVQPVDPLDEWVSPPFEPQVRDGRLYARGAVDDKGQVYMHLKAVEAHLRTRGELPVNLRLLVEGEEEIGSEHFEPLVETMRDRLVRRRGVISDTGIFARGVPSLTVGLRGLAGVEVEVRGPSLDLHSGVFGGAVQNPVEALARMLASLKDPATGRVTVAGLLRRRRRADRGRARRRTASLPFDEAAFRATRRRHHGDGGGGGLVGARARAGCAPRWRSTASGAATRAPGARRSSPPMRGQDQLPPGARPGPGRDRRAGGRRAACGDTARGHLRGDRARGAATR